MYEPLTDFGIPTVSLDYYYSKMSKYAIAAQYRQPYSRAAQHVNEELAAVIRQALQSGPLAVGHIAHRSGLPINELRDTAEGLVNRGDLLRHRGATAAIQYRLAYAA